MEHDPWCPANGRPSCTQASQPDFDCDDYGHLPPCEEFYCLCDLIACVRADEASIPPLTTEYKRGWNDAEVDYFKGWNDALEHVRGVLDNMACQNIPAGHRHQSHTGPCTVSRHELRTALTRLRTAT